MNGSRRICAARGISDDARHYRRAAGGGQHRPEEGRMNRVGWHRFDALATAAALDDQSWRGRVIARNACVEKIAACRRRVICAARTGLL